MAFKKRRCKSRYHTVSKLQRGVKRMVFFTTFAAYIHTSILIQCWLKKPLWRAKLVQW